MISETGYLLLLSRSMTEIKLKQRNSLLYMGWLLIDDIYKLLLFPSHQWSLYRVTSNSNVVQSRIYYTWIYLDCTWIPDTFHHFRTCFLKKSNARTRQLARRFRTHFHNSVNSVRSYWIHEVIVHGPFFVTYWNHILKVVLHNVSYSKHIVFVSTKSLCREHPQLCFYFMCTRHKKNILPHKNILLSA